MEMESIKVSVRLRPLSGHEKKERLQPVWQITDLTKLHLDKALLPQIIANRQTLPNKISSYEFHRCFNDQTQNYSIFQEFAKNVVLASLKGINGTVFMYGQTGAGKTFAMLGDSPNLLFKENNVQNFIQASLQEKQYNNIGILIYSLMELFKMINKDTERFYHLQCSYYEIYNEMVYDLLSKTTHDYTQSLQINVNKLNEFEPRGLSELPVTSLDQVIGYIRKGEKNRHYAETILNHQSSRSHTIFKLNLQCFNERTQVIQKQSQFHSNLVFVDLAGSERLSQNEKSEEYIHQLYETQEEIKSSTKDRIRESQMINKSLYYLTRVIAMKTQKQQQHIPYRNSTLTKLLKGSLTGNSKTVILLCINPTLLHIDQTLQTIKFGENARLIENKVDINVVQFKQQQSQIEGLQVVQTLKRKIQVFSIQNYVKKGMEQDYNKQQIQLSQVQSQLQSTLKEKEHLVQNIRRLVKNDSLFNTETHEQYMNRCATLFLQTQSSTAITESQFNFEQISQMVNDYDGQIVIDRYKEILNQLQAQQLKNRVLEEECQRLHKKILKHDVLIENFQQSQKQIVHDVDSLSKIARKSNTSENKKYQSNTQKLIESNTKELKLDYIPSIEVTPLRKRSRQQSQYLSSGKNEIDINPSSIYNSAESVGMNHSQDSEFESQLKQIIQTLDNYKPSVDESASDFLKTDESDKKENTFSFKKHKNKDSLPTTQTKGNIKEFKPQILRKSSPDFSKHKTQLVKQTRSLSSDSKRCQQDPITKVDIRALSTKKKRETSKAKIEISSFAEKLLNLTTKIDKKKQVQISEQKIEHPLPPKKCIQPKKAQLQNVVSSFRQNMKQQPQSFEEHKQKMQQKTNHKKIEKMSSQLNRFNIQEIIFETESELTEEASRDSIRHKKQML